MNSSSHQIHLQRTIGQLVERIAMFLARPGEKLWFSNSSTHKFTNDSNHSIIRMRSEVSILGCLPLSCVCRPYKHLAIIKSPAVTGRDIRHIGILTWVFIFCVCDTQSCLFCSAFDSAIRDSHDAKPGNYVHYNVLYMLKSGKRHLNETF